MAQTRVREGRVSVPAGVDLATGEVEWLQVLLAVPTGQEIWDLETVLERLVV